MALFMVYGKLKGNRNIIKLFFLLVIIWSVEPIVIVRYICNIICLAFVDHLVTWSLKV